MHVEFSGAAREVTGSHHLLTVGEHTIALDCGLFQGHRGESRDKNLRLPFPPERLSAVILSHAHIDHAGRLPFLTRQGYTGSVFTTPATRDLCAIMLADSAFIQEKDVEFLRSKVREAIEANSHSETGTQLFQAHGVGATIKDVTLTVGGPSYWYW